MGSDCLVVPVPEGQHRLPRSSPNAGRSDLGRESPERDSGFDYSCRLFPEDSVYPFQSFPLRQPGGPLVSGLSEDASHLPVPGRIREDEKECRDLRAVREGSYERRVAPHVPGREPPSQVYSSSLQKGIARIAFAAQEAQSWEREIPIIPVGLQYESHTTFGSRLLIQFGPPVSSLAYKNLHAGNPKEAERALTAELFEEMKRLLVLPPQDDQSYESAVQRWTLNKGRFPDLMDQFRADREIVSGGDEPRGERALERHPWRKLVGYALSVPGIVIHLPVILVSLAWERAFVWDEHLVPAARFAAGLLLTPLWYMLALALWHSRGGSIPSDVLLLGLMPLSLWLWSRLWHWTR
jgi:hypothetical protein